MVGPDSRATRSSAPALSLEAPSSTSAASRASMKQPLQFAFVENLEMGWDIGLERKEPQQPLGEGVQRLNLEAAGALDGAREQLPREDEVARTRRVRAALDDRLREGVVAEARPERELAEHAIGHVGRRRLGVSEAQDLRRRRSVEQQPQHALCEDMGLAAAGVGGDPGRCFRIRGPGLPLP